MFSTRLTNGVTVWYSSDTSGPIVLRYPDGSQVRTTWNQLGLIEAMVNSLREAYEYLLQRAAVDSSEGGPPVDKLVELDDLLFAIRDGGRGSETPMSGREVSC